jgi:hypothetical protein
MDGATLAKVPDAVIAEIRSREREGAIDLLPKIRPGDQVRVLRGPFRDQLPIYAGMSGRDRVAVLLRLLGVSAGSSCTDAMWRSDKAAPKGQSRGVAWLGISSAMSLRAARYLQGCGQFNVGRQPAYVPTRPLGPLPATLRTNEPSARTQVPQGRPRARSIQHRFRSTGAILVGIREPVQNVGHRHGIYRRQ